MLASDLVISLHMSRDVISFTDSQARNLTKCASVSFVFHIRCEHGRKVTGSQKCHLSCDQRCIHITRRSARLSFIDRET
jgi:hypothetical protein